MTESKELIEQLEKHEVPLPFALRIYHRTIHKEQKPELPGFSVPEMTEYTNIGTIRVGVVRKDLLRPEDIEFYRRCEEVDVAPGLWKVEEAMSAYGTSVIATDKYLEHEKLFNNAVANEIAKRIEKDKKAVWVDIGIGEAEEVDRIYNRLKKDLKGELVLIGIDRFRGMIKKSLRLKTMKNLEYHPVIADASHLPFVDLNAIFTLNTNTPGNFRRSEWENIDLRISESMGEDSVIFKSVYYAPKYVDKWTEAVKKCCIANSYFWNFPSARIAADMHENKRTLEESLTKPLWSWQVFNELTNSVEGYCAQWNGDENCFEIRPVYRSHRFTRKELRESAKKAGLKVDIQRDGKERMYLVELRKN